MNVNAVDIGEDCETETSGVYLPSQSEIREACAVIRSEWSEEETRRRTVPAFRNRLSLMTATIGE
jgi:hypothetical protein